MNVCVEYVLYVCLSVLYIAIVVVFFLLRLLNKTTQRCTRPYETGSMSYGIVFNRLQNGDYRRLWSRRSSWHRLRESLLLKVS